MKATGLSTALPSQENVPFRAKRPDPGRDDDGDRESSREKVRGHAGDDLERYVEPQQPAREREENREREESRRLHLASQRLANSLVVVPPGDVSVQDVHRRQVPERLGEIANVGIDHWPPARDVAEDPRDPRGPRDGIDVGVTNEEQDVSEQDAQDYDDDRGG